MAVSLFDVVYLESKIVCFVNDKTEVLVIQVLRSNLSASCILLNGDFWFLDYFNRVTVVRNLAEVVRISY